MELKELNNDEKELLSICRKLVNIQVNREFLEKYIELDCKNLGDFGVKYFSSSAI